MSEEKYQIAEKARYAKLILLKDELQHFDTVLRDKCADVDGWIMKLRATRLVFLTLNNVKDSADNFRADDDKNLVLKTRAIRRNLVFANHFRNKGIGHLNDNLLKRAVQWHPHLFHESQKDGGSAQLAEANRAVIEAAVNSFIDENGDQKVFGTEIDLVYPPDAERFFSYLAEIVNEAIEWLSVAAASQIGNIHHHTDEDVRELAAVAGKTNFDLKATTDIDISEEEIEASLSVALEKLEQQGCEPQVLEVLRKLMAK